jgi:hypothetical protein
MALGPRQGSSQVFPGSEAQPSLPSALVCPWEGTRLKNTATPPEVFLTPTPLPSPGPGKDREGDGSLRPEATNIKSIAGSYSNSSWAQNHKHGQRGWKTKSGEGITQVPACRHQGHLPPVSQPSSYRHGHSAFQRKLRAQRNGTDTCASQHLYPWQKHPRCPGQNGTVTPLLW